jgi:hypothetical protein
VSALRCATQSRTTPLASSRDIGEAVTVAAAQDERDH